MLEAIALWRHHPTQIEAGLTVHCHRSIGEWHRGEMSSRQLLGLIAEFPEDSQYRRRAERTYRLCVDPDGGRHLFGAVGQLPEWASVLETFVDWTFDRKIAARTARELAALRADNTGEAPDSGALTEPLQQILARLDYEARSTRRAGVTSVIRAGLFNTHQ